MADVLTFLLARKALSCATLMPLTSSWVGAESGSTLQREAGMQAGAWEAGWELQGRLATDAGVEVENPKKGLTAAATPARPSALGGSCCAPCPCT
jgi:hypothetical protein